MSTVVVMAKAPAAGRVKTRLCPPCTPHEAAGIARAALADTLDAVLSARVDNRVLSLDGSPGAWLPCGFSVSAQHGDGLASRLDHAVRIADARYGSPVLVIGADTPQLTAAAVEDAFAALRGADAALGLATDGGYWGLAVSSVIPGLFDQVPMSAPDTGQAQLHRLAALGLRVRALPVMTDVDDYNDALAVSDLVPDGRFAHAVRAVSARTRWASDPRDPGHLRPEKPASRALDHANGWCR